VRIEDKNRALLRLSTLSISSVTAFERLEVTGGNSSGESAILREASLSAQVWLQLQLLLSSFFCLPKSGKIYYGFVFLLLPGE